MRRNRRRFWKAASGDDKQAAYLTLYECLETVTRLMAPFVPFIAERVYRNLAGGAAPCAAQRAHGGVADFNPQRLDRQLLGGNASRATRRRPRQGGSQRVEAQSAPAARAAAGPRAGEAAAAAVRRNAEQILEELNVKALELLAQDATLVSYRIKPNLPVIGKRYGKLIPAIRQYLAAADGAAIAAAVARRTTAEIRDRRTRSSTYSRRTSWSRAALPRVSLARKRAAISSGSTRLDRRLRREGLARELIRSVQDARKQAGLEVSDRIVLFVEGDDERRDGSSRAPRLCDGRNVGEPLALARGLVRREPRAGRLELDHPFGSRRRGGDGVTERRWFGLRSGASNWLWLSMAVIVLDQWTKYLITAHLAEYEQIRLLSVLDLLRLHNEGAAFSFLSNASGLAAVVVHRARHRRQHRDLRVAQAVTGARPALLAAGLALVWEVPWGT